MSISSQLQLAQPSPRKWQSTTVRQIVPSSITQGHIQVPNVKNMVQAFPTNKNRGKSSFFQKQQTTQYSQFNKYLLQSNPNKSYSELPTPSSQSPPRKNNSSRLYLTHSGTPMNLTIVGNPQPLEMLPSQVFQQHFNNKESRSAKKNVDNHPTQQLHPLSQQLTPSAPFPLQSTNNRIIIARRGASTYLARAGNNTNHLSSFHQNVIQEVESEARTLKLEASTTGAGVQTMLTPTASEMNFIKKTPSTINFTNSSRPQTQQTANNNNRGSRLILEQRESFSVLVGNNLPVTLIQQQQSLKNMVHVERIRKLTQAQRILINSGGQTLRHNESQVDINLESPRKKETVPAAAVVATPVIFKSQAQQIVQHSNMFPARRISNSQPFLRSQQHKRLNESPIRTSTKQKENSRPQSTSNLLNSNRLKHLQSALSEFRVSNESVIQSKPVTITQNHFLRYKNKRSYSNYSPVIQPSPQQQINGLKFQVTDFNLMNDDEINLWRQAQLLKLQQHKLAATYAKKSEDLVAQSQEEIQLVLPSYIINRRHITPGAVFNAKQVAKPHENNVQQLSFEQSPSKLTTLGMINLRPQPRTNQNMISNQLHPYLDLASNQVKLIHNETHSTGVSPRTQEGVQQIYEQYTSQINSQRQEQANNLQVQSNKAIVLSRRSSSNFSKTGVNNPEPLTISGTGALQIA